MSMLTEPYFIGTGEEQLHPSQAKGYSFRDGPVHDVNLFLPRFGDGDQGDGGGAVFAYSGQEASICYGIFHI